MGLPQKAICIRMTIILLIRDKRTCRAERGCAMLAASNNDFIYQRKD